MPLPSPRRAESNRFSLSTVIIGCLIGIVIGMVITVMALLITRHRRTTATPGASISQLLHLAVQGSPAGVAVVTHKGDVVLSNTQAHALGIISDHAVRPDVWHQAHNVFTHQQPQTLDLPAGQQRTGSRVSAVKAVIKPLTLADGDFVIIYCTDESENMRLEAARRDFVANVSHELKTPVGGMALLSEALIESRDDPDTVEHFGIKLNKEAQRMANLINELIALSKLQGAEPLPNMEPVSVDEVIDDALQRTQLAADNANITIDRGPASSAFVMGDKTLLVTAMANLLSNAINYSPANTSVSISQRRAGGNVHISVTDRGIGIAPEDQQRVFERFFRVDKARSRATGGTGLGLAIVKHVAANHGGAITVWSRRGVGSTFTLELPELLDPSGGTTNERTT